MQGLQGLSEGKEVVVRSGLWVQHSAAAPEPPRQTLWNSGLIGWARRKAEDSLDTQLRALRSAVPGTLRGSTLHLANRGVDWALSTVAPEEEALRRLSSAQAVEVLLPASEKSAAATLLALRRLAEHRYRVHDRWHKLSSLCLFFSVPISILPVPSAFLYWNVFRVWGNLRGKQGAHALLELLRRDGEEAAATDAASLPPCTGQAEGGGCCRAAAVWAELPPSRRLAAIHCVRVEELHQSEGDDSQEELPARLTKALEVETALNTPGLQELLRRTYLAERRISARSEDYGLYTSRGAVSLSGVPRKEHRA